MKEEKTETMNRPEETVAEIISNMRLGTKIIGYWSSCDLNEILQYHADRLEAARSRETGSIGAMRAALEFVRDEIGRMWEWAMIEDRVDAALSAPTRNCDKYATEAEAKSAFLAWRNKIYEFDCDLGDLKHNIDGITQEYADWLLAPTEGDTIDILPRCAISPKQDETCPDKRN